jgi:hypothetical protein
MVHVSGSLKGVKASSLARACEATHEYVDSPMEFHRGEDDRSGRFRRGIAERGEGHMKGVESIHTSGQMANEAGSKK